MVPLPSLSNPACPQNLMEMRIGAHRQAAFSCLALQQTPLPKCHPAVCFTWGPGVRWPVHPESLALLSRERTCRKAWEKGETTPSQESTCVPGCCQDSPLLWFTLWRSRDPGRQCCQLLGIWGSWQLPINANTSERDPTKRCTSKSGGCLAWAEGKQLKYLEWQWECERVFFPCLWWSWGHCLISINITQRVLRNLCMVLDPAWHWVLPWRCWRSGSMVTAADLLPHYCLGSGKVGKGGWLKGVGREEEKGKKR